MLQCATKFYQIERSRKYISPIILLLIHTRDRL